ncbi:putative kinesin heavy chain [Operophtera brumata]|uniref:Putative kinesin heavy chain n=1 Tax=Operophtera brumata TaxID=104452 RepID=A0A0L7K5B7_OPEBR|nr:putative kinesin heavy chain [Operophtera brumata]
MIDLAGSERAFAMSAVGDRFKEGANINKSLFLGGNCKTVMIANVSPTSCSSEDTYNTLQIAARANLIKLNIKATIVEGDMRLPQYVTIKEKLEKKVKDLEKKEKDWEKKGKYYEKTVNELRAKLTQSSLKVKKLLSLMSLQRALAQQYCLSMRTFSHMADLEHSSSTDAMEQV